MAADQPPAGEAAWVHGHAHDPNPLPPAGDGSFVATSPIGGEMRFDLAALAELPQCTVSGCLIVSTGHGTSGPFTFGGVLLGTVIEAAIRAALARSPAAGQAEGLAAGQAAGQSTLPGAWRYVDVVSADGFGTRLLPEHLAAGEPPIVLALRRDGQPLTRAQGLVRLIVPSEREDALRQVKWVARVEIH